MWESFFRIPPCRRPLLTETPSTGTPCIEALIVVCHNASRECCCGSRYLMHLPPTPCMYLPMHTTPCMYLHTTPCMYQSCCVTTHLTHTCMNHVLTHQHSYSYIYIHQCINAQSCCLTTHLIIMLKDVVTQCLSSSININKLNSVVLQRLWILTLESRCKTPEFSADKAERIARINSKQLCEYQLVAPTINHWLHQRFALFLCINSRSTTASDMASDMGR